ncbi:MAG: D-aminoacylase [Nitrospirota bacterium]
MGINYLIKGGIVIDGADDNSVPVKADVAIDGSIVKHVGDLSRMSSDNIIDAEGMCVCPGFIDAHAHSDFVILADGRAEGKICQGITTEINGNCGMSAAPLLGLAQEQRENEFNELNIKERWSTLEEYFDLLQARSFALNFLTLAGHGNIRASVAGYSDRVLSESEMNTACSLLTDAMKSGARGFSTGLIYPPGVFAGTSEIIGLAREAVKLNGIYTTHMRSEGDNLLESVEETIKIAAESGIRVHISHLKTSGEENWSKLEGVLEIIDEAHQKGLAVTCDRYPYIAGSTDLDAVLPAWTFEGGHKKEIERLKNDRENIADEIRRLYPDPSCWDKIVISSVITEKNRWMEGKSISEICGSLNKDPLVFLFEVLIEEDLDVGAIFFSMNEDNLMTILKQPYCMIGSDSTARSFRGITAKGKPHPRGFGTFPRVIRKYVNEQKILTLENAIHKMTGLPARTFNISMRGVIRKGYFADVVVFDPEKISDVAEYQNPFQEPEGILHVFVNGVPVVLDGELTGALPGRIL